jgi:ABC-type glutathione transport system ATPase component
VTLHPRSAVYLGTPPDAVQPYTAAHQPLPSVTARPGQIRRADHPEPASGTDITSETADTSVLWARGLRQQYGRDEGLVRAVDRVDLDVAAGQTVAVMGPSGCGKPTLL